MYCNNSTNSRYLQNVLMLWHLLRKVEGIGPVKPWQPNALCIVVPTPTLRACFSAGREDKSVEKIICESLLTSEGFFFDK